MNIDIIAALLKKKVKAEKNTIKIYMPLSGNLGDTVNVLPILSGIYKETGYKITLLVTERMKMFLGFREFLLFQDFIADVLYASDIAPDKSFYKLSLVDDFQKHPVRPWETQRLYEYFLKKYKLNFSIDDNLIINVPDVEWKDDFFVIGDRQVNSQLDQRRKFDVLRNSGKFSDSSCFYLDYKQPILTNLAIIKASSKPFISTFTGISILADLMGKETQVFYSDDLVNWDNKPVEYSFNKHFYRDRKSKLFALNDADFY